MPTLDPKLKPNLDDSSALNINNSTLDFQYILLLQSDFDLSSFSSQETFVPKMALVKWMMAGTSEKLRIWESRLPS